MRIQAEVRMRERAVERSFDRSRKKVLARSGAYVRKIARDHVKHRSNPDERSEPFHSPYDHFGLKRSIMFGVDDGSAYIGPVLIRGGLSNVARRHEFGGYGYVRTSPFGDIDRRRMAIGDVAPVTESHLAKADSVRSRPGIVDRRTGRNVVFIRIRTKSQLAHSRRLAGRLSRQERKTTRVYYPKRPYMAPALMKSLPYLKGFWKDSIKE